MLFYIACFIATLQVKLLYPPTIWQGLLLGTTMAKSAKYFPEIVSFSKQKKRTIHLLLCSSHITIFHNHMKKENRKHQIRDTGRGCNARGGGSVDGL